MKNRRNTPGVFPVPGSDFVTVIPLGGTERVGMNATLFGYAGRWILIDAGATFAGADDDYAAEFGARFGGEVQQIIPDFRVISEIIPRLDGIVITHSHEDHIGALAAMYMYKEAWPGLENIPIYAGEYAKGIIKRKIEEVGGKPKIIPIRARARKEIGKFVIQPISVTHSAPETFMLAIETNLGTMVFGSDTKIDPNPIIGDRTDFNLLRHLSSRGVMAYFGDSTNASHDGRSTSELEVSKNIEEIMQTYNGRVVVSTFASNLSRIAGVVNAAKNSRRVIGAAGRSILSNIDIATSGNAPIVSKNQFNFAMRWEVNEAPAHNAAFVCTGTQGEQGSALRRAVEELELGTFNNKGILLEPGDMVIHSGRIIPGNEKSVEAMFSTLRAKGVKVLTADSAKKPIHASGHAKRGELEEFYETIRPRFAIPVHGHGDLIAAHHDIAMSSRSVKKVITPQEGEILQINQGGMKIAGKIAIGQLAVLSIGEKYSGTNRILAWNKADPIDITKQIDKEPSPLPRFDHRSNQRRDNYGKHSYRTSYRPVEVQEPEKILENPPTFSQFI